MSTDTITEYVRTATDDPALSVRFDGESGYVESDGTVVVPTDLSRYAARELTADEQFAVQTMTALHLATIRAETPLDAKESIVTEFRERYAESFEPTLILDGDEADGDTETDDADDDEGLSLSPSTVAGHTLNAIEDARARAVVLDENPDFRATAVAVITAVMDARPPLTDYEPPGTMQEGLVHLTATGYVDGYAEADADTREFLAWARPRFDAARHEADAEVRMEMAEELAEGLLSVAGVEGADTDVSADPAVVAELDALDADPAVGAWHGVEGEVPAEIPVPASVASE